MRCAIIEFLSAFGSRTANYDSIIKTSQRLLCCAGTMRRGMLFCSRQKQKRHKGRNEMLCEAITKRIFINVSPTTSRRSRFGTVYCVASASIIFSTY